MVVLQGLIDNKKEFTEHLNDILVETITKELQNIYQNVATNKSNNILHGFQESLTKIPYWNHIEIEKLYNKVIETSKCNYLTELINALIVTHIKIIAIVNNAPSIKKLKIRVPITQNFIHKALILSARLSWKKAYLFYHNVKSIERQYNLNKIEELVKVAIRQTVRSCLHYESIFKILGTENIVKDNDSELSDYDTESEGEEDNTSEEDINKIGTIPIIPKLKLEKELETESEELEPKPDTEPEEVKPKPETEPETESEEELEPKPETEPKPESEEELEPKPETEPEPEEKPNSDTELKTESEEELEPIPESNTDKGIKSESSSPKIKELIIQPKKLIVPLQGSKVKNAFF